jgi:putative flippase GtrA
MSNRFIIQAFKYGIAGIFNTLLTAVVIWFMMQFVFNLKGNKNMRQALFLSQIP